MANTVDVTRESGRNAANAQANHLPAAFDSLTIVLDNNITDTTDATAINLTAGVTLTIESAAGLFGGSGATVTLDNVDFSLDAAVSQPGGAIATSFPSA